MKNKIKIATDLEQSKKLAEILPIESADMYWFNEHIDMTQTKYRLFVVDKSNKYVDFFKSYAIAVDNNEIIPCWSLAALLNYLRDIDFFPEIDADEHTATMSINYYDEDEGKLLNPVHNIKVKAENFIDACYEMILKLHEKKIL